MSTFPSIHVAACDLVSREIDLQEKVCSHVNQDSNCKWKNREKFDTGRGNLCLITKEKSRDQLQFYCHMLIPFTDHHGFSPFKTWHEAKVETTTPNWGLRIEEGQFPNEHSGFLQKGYLDRKAWAASQYSTIQENFIYLKFNGTH